MLCQVEFSGAGVTEGVEIRVKVQVSGHKVIHALVQIQPNFLYHAAHFANFEGILGFFIPSII